MEYISAFKFKSSWEVAQHFGKSNVKLIRRSKTPGKWGEK
jgi:hypothetical protein